MGVQSRRLKLGGWRSFPVGVSRLSSLALLVHPVFYSNNLYIVEMESVKQRIRAAAARQKAEKKAQEAGGEASSTPKVPTGQAKRKPDGSDRRPAKKAAVTPSSMKEKSPSKPSHGVGKGLMTSQGPIIESPCRLLTHRDYAVEEVRSFVKPADIEPCDQLETEDLGASALFDLARVCLLPLSKWLYLALIPFLTAVFFSLGLGACDIPSRSLHCEGRCHHSSQEA